MTTESPAAAVSISSALATLTPLIGRSPTSSETDWAATLGAVGNAGIYVVDYSGVSEWERHQRGDETPPRNPPTTHSIDHRTRR